MELAEIGERRLSLETPTVTMEVRLVADRTAIIDIKGDVTASCEPVLMSAYEAAGGAHAARLLLNFNDLGYMNSSGIGQLVTLLVRANRQHQRLGAYGLSEHYRQIFELTRLDEAISIFEDESAALAAPKS
jgi:anti-sigma B factor antagonist